MVARRGALRRAQGQREEDMQTRAVVVGMVVAALWLGGCAGGGGLFRDRDDRAEAARLLLQRQADEEAALLEDEAEAEAAREAQNKRALQALQEADEDAERRKREEAADSEQERRHRRELKEAEHDAKIRELHKGSAAPPPDVERHLIAVEKLAAAQTEYAHELSYCSHSSETAVQQDECYEERVRRLLLKFSAADADAAKALELLPSGDGRRIYLAMGEEILEVSRADDAEDEAWQASLDTAGTYDDAGRAYNDALAAWRAAPSHSNADEAAAFHAAKRRWEAADKRSMEATRAWADAAVASADARRAIAAKLRAVVENWNTDSAPQTETTSAAAQNAQPAKAPQSAPMNATH